MGYFSRIFITLAVLLASACASQQTAENAAGNEVATSAGNTVVAQNDSSGDDPNEMICRREQVTGTNFRRRVCMTRAERQQRLEVSQEEMLERRSADRGL